MSAIYSWSYYREFGINIFNFSGLSDFLLIFFSDISTSIDLLLYVGIYTLGIFLLFVIAGKLFGKKEPERPNAEKFEPPGRLQSGDSKEVHISGTRVVGPSPHATTVSIGQRRWGGTKRTGLASTICWGTRGSGSRTAGMRVIRPPQVTDGPGSAGIAVSVFCAAAPGSTNQRGFVQPAVSATMPRSGTSTTGSVSPGRSLRS